MTQTAVAKVEVLVDQDAEIALFRGSRVRFGLSNEDELSRSCPLEFRGTNPWSEYAKRLSHNIKGDAAMYFWWEWRLGNAKMRDEQFECFKALCRGTGLLVHDKMAIAGWMLSRMLFSVPSYSAEPML